MKETFLTKNPKETKELAKKLAQEIILAKNKDKAVIIKLYGNLGGGKTTFVQGFAKGLDINDKILSPTFVILKKFQINQKSKAKNSGLKYLYHIDCYRLENKKDLLELGFEEIASDPKNIVLIEWPERVKEVIPEKSASIDFEFISENERKITINH